ncbi:MAG: type I-B CRISPR-associated endonuclease Cas1b [Candidatus Heimdallarchaeota archaeon]
MKETYYIFNSGELVRKGNTVYFKNEEQETKRALPIENIESLYIFGEITLNKRLLAFFNEKNILLHFFNYYGFYIGSFMPRDYLNSGMLIVKQVEHYLDKSKRLLLAREFLRGATHNMLSNLKYYQRRGKELEEEIKTITKHLGEQKTSPEVAALMGLEGNIRKIYYKAFNKILREGYTFTERVKRPPDNKINCLISFGNSLVYRTVLTEIYHTFLNPTISYLHEPAEGRFSLSLDLAEIFKPVIVDQVIFSLVNKQKINDEDFKKELKFCYLNEKGRTKFVKEFDERLHATVKNEKLKRNISYKRLIRLECYKLIKHVIGDKRFIAYKKSW